MTWAHYPLPTREPSWEQVLELRPGADIYAARASFKSKAAVCTDPAALAAINKAWATAQAALGG